MCAIVAGKFGLLLALSLLVLSLLASCSKRSGSPEPDPGPDPGPGPAQPPCTDTLTLTAWCFFDDVAPDGAMTALAAENTAPSLASGYIQNGIVRLRVMLTQCDAVASTERSVTLQYSADQNEWTDIAAQDGQVGHSFLYADGAASSGSSLGSLRLTNAETAGMYHETSTVRESIAAEEHGLELDFAIKCHWPTTGTWYFRVVWDGQALPVLTSYPHAVVTAANRSHTITSVGNDFGGEGLSEELRQGDFKRVWFDGANYWIFYTYTGTTNSLLYRHWPGNGEWSAPASVPVSDTTDNGRHRPWVENIGGTHTVFLLLGNNQGRGVTRFLRRGTIAGTAIVWDDERAVEADFGDEANAIGVDDGDFVWIGGVENGGGTVWARRATSANSVSAFQPVRTVASAGASETRAAHVIGLGSDKAMVLWYDTSATDILCALVTDAGGFGAITTVNTVGCHDQDWGFTVDKQSGHVYVVHTDSTTNGAGNLKLRVFHIASEIWTNGANPPTGEGNRPFGGDDHTPVQLIGNDLYVFFTLADGGEDRAVAFLEYTGPGAAGTWDSSPTLHSGSGRCNLDRIVTVGPGTPANRVLAIVAAGDNPNSGGPIDLEWWD
ncbi:MAG TPA: hypothetical protein VF384_04170 [Planctomycetota bacterium]